MTAECCRAPVNAGAPVLCVQAAAAVRFAAVTALATFMTAQLAPSEVLLAEAQPKAGLLPLLAQCLDEDWYSDVRHTACYVEQLLLQQVSSMLSCVTCQHSRHFCGTMVIAFCTTMRQARRPGLSLLQHMYL